MNKVCKLLGKKAGKSQIKEQPDVSLSEELKHTKMKTAHLFYRSSIPFPIDNIPDDQFMRLANYFHSLRLQDSLKKTADKGIMTKPIYQGQVTAKLNRTQFVAMNVEEISDFSSSMGYTNTGVMSGAFSRSKAPIGKKITEESQSSDEEPITIKGLTRVVQPKDKLKQKQMELMATPRDFLKKAGRLSAAADSTLNKLGSVLTKLVKKKKIELIKLSRTSTIDLNKIANVKK